jgi:hypothetical protein
VGEGWKALLTHMGGVCRCFGAGEDAASMLNRLVNFWIMESEVCDKEERERGESRVCIC